jgi:cytochrome c biogenesis protein CcmG/thiol:disulfide interchange protein DsbE
MKIPMCYTQPPRGYWLGAAALALCCLAGALSKPQLSRAQLIDQAAPRPGPAIGRTAVAFNLQTLDGASIALESFRGKPLVINFFASWCDPCREEMPLIKELATAGAKQGFSVLGIAVEDSRAAMTEYRQEAKLIFPIALDLNSTVKRAYRIFGPPATFFIDKQGIIRDMVFGPITRERALDALKRAGASGKNFK